MMSTSFLDVILVNAMIILHDVFILNFYGKVSNFPSWYAKFFSMTDKNKSYDGWFSKNVFACSVVGAVAETLKNVYDST